MLGRHLLSCPAGSALGPKVGCNLIDGLVKRGQLYRNVGRLLAGCKSRINLLECPVFWIGLCSLYGGWRGEVGSGVNVDIGAVAYVYPGDINLDYVELLGSISYTLGPVEAKLGAAYSPSQDNLGNADNIYGYFDASLGIPSTPVTVTAHIGHEDGSLAGPTGKKWDWSLGAAVVVDRFTLGLTYVDTDVNRVFDPRKIAGAAVVASVKVDF